jgi:hypothetical protein
MKNFFLDTLTAEQGAPIVATFKDGTSAQYTSNILNLLKSDKSVINIIDATTGECLHINEN